MQPGIRSFVMSIYRIDRYPHLIEKWQAGADMVLAKPQTAQLTGARRKTAEWFINCTIKSSNPKIEERRFQVNESREVIENIKQMP